MEDFVFKNKREKTIKNENEGQTGISCENYFIFILLFEFKLLASWMSDFKTKSQITKLNAHTF